MKKILFTIGGLFLAFAVSQNAGSMQTWNMSNMAGNIASQAGSVLNLLGIWDGQQGKVIFYPDGTLLYNGTASRNSDNGSWKTDGLTLVSASQTTGKTSRYSLTRENAQNGDATIVIGRGKFITAYNRPKW